MMPELNTRWRLGPTALVIFVIVLAVYVVNPDPMWVGDMNSTSVFAFNVLEFKTYWLDAFATGELYQGYNSFSFAPLPAGNFGGGRWTLAYPIGSAIVTFPVYAVLWAYFKLVHPALDMTSAAFGPYRIAASHIAASVVSAGTVVLFFLISRRRFPAAVALATTACLAFATMQWGLQSQSMLQHGPSAFVVIAAAYLLLRAGDSSGAHAAGWLAAAGALAGMLFMIRPTNLAFAAALLVFAVLRFRSRSLVFFLLFLVTFGLSLGWNYLFFQNWLGPAAGGQTHTYYASAGTFIAAFTGLAFSPIRGLISNSPVLIFTIAGIGIAIVAMFRAVRHWDFNNVDPDTLLFGMLLGACAVLYLSYCFSPFWEGGTYGTRYISETVPILAYFLNFSPTVQRAPGRRWGRVATVLLVLCIAIGVVQQATAIAGGHRGQANWSSLPYGELDVPDDRRWAYMREAPLRGFETRLWSVRDGLVERIWRGVYANRFLMNESIASSTDYAKRCTSTILSVEDAHGLPIEQWHLMGMDGSTPYLSRLWDLFSEGRKFVRVRIRNDGSVPLYSYREGLHWGFATLVHKVTKDSGGAVYEGGNIHLTGTLLPGETGEAIGSMEITTQKGRYRIEGRMAINGLGYCGEVQQLGAVIVD
jgi:hypothetical protein